MYIEFFGNFIFLFYFGNFLEHFKVFYDTIWIWNLNL